MALGLSVKKCQACAELQAQDAGDSRTGGEVDAHSVRGAWHQRHGQRAGVREVSDSSFVAALFLLPF